MFDEQLKIAKHRQLLITSSQCRVSCVGYERRTASDDVGDMKPTTSEFSASPTETVANSTTEGRVFKEIAEQRLSSGFR